MGKKPNEYEIAEYELEEQNEVEEDRDPNECFYLTDGITQNDNENFYYFFNKRLYKEIYIESSFILFPRVIT